MPRRPLGQHFLVDRGAIARIVAAALDGPPLPVVEIGPGRGALTVPLAEAAGRVAAIELDERLADGLEARLGVERLALLRGDVLRRPLAEAAAALGRAGERLAVVGNLPYLVSKPICSKLVAERAAVGRAVLMFQAEVAERLLARPGSRDYGPLGILVGEAYAVTRLFDLGPRAFRPPPQVRSTVTAWAPRPQAPDDDELRRLRTCLGACFRARRKTVQNNLRAALGDAAAAAALTGARVDGALRPEQLEPAAFRRLAALWPGA